MPFRKAGKRLLLDHAEVADGDHEEFLLLFRFRIKPLSLLTHPVPSSLRELQLRRVVGNADRPPLPSTGELRGVEGPDLDATEIPRDLRSLAAALAHGGDEQVDLPD